MNFTYPNKLCTLPHRKMPLSTIICSIFFALESVYLYSEKKMWRIVNSEREKDGSIVSMVEKDGRGVGVSLGSTNSPLQCFLVVRGLTFLMPSNKTKVSSNMPENQ